MESTLVTEDQKSAEHSECPRCGSTHTKFCYYNNYNKSQPRYFCKGCRRHWTKGGILRNVPLGNIRKKKRQRKPPNSALVTNTSIISSQDEQEGAAEDQSRVVSDALLDNILGSRDDQNGVFSCATSLKSADQSTEFCYSDIGAFDIKKSAILEPDDQCSDAYGYILSQPFQNPTTTGAMDMSNLSWDWNEINSLISADLDIPLDEAEISF